MPLYPSVVIGAALLATLAQTPAAAAQSSTSSSPSSSSSTSQGARKGSATHAAPSTKSASQEQLPVSLERIREGVMRDSRIELPDFGVPTFRIAVEQQTIKLPGEYDKRNAVGDVRGYHFSNAHQEFLNMSSPTGNPPAQQAGGIPVFALFASLKKGFREREAARIRAQITDELEQIDPEAARGRRATAPPRN